MKKIAVNIITTNNEPYLKDTLESVKPLDPEYVIVYNGKENSEESELCLQYAPNSTYFHKWNEDFSELRNIALKNTNSYWILWIDSDETIDKESADKITELVNSKPSNPYHNFKLIHGNTTVSQLRMFSKTSKEKWRFPIHEKIIPEILPDWHPDIKITHRINNNERSHIRNINILNKALESNPASPEYNFYLAIDYHLVGQHMKSLLCAEKFLLHYPIRSVDVKKMYMRYLISWIYTFQMRNYQKAIQIILGQLAQNCNIAEFWCLLGDIYIKLGKFDSARIFFQNAITMGKYKYDHMWITDLDKYEVYPEIKIKLCETKKGIDFSEIIRENQKMIIP
jgi:tetratricopeptide (TPR) repeat protein